MSFGPINMLRQLKRLDQKKRFYSQFVSKGDLVFDIGANIGERTEVFIKSGMRTISVEPHPVCAMTLMKKFAGYANFKLEQLAVSTKDGDTDFNLCELSECSSLSSEFIGFYSTHYNKLTWNEKISVKTKSLDSLITTHGLPVFCKIDVEGHEPEVFKGLSQPIPYIAFEFNTPLIHQAIESLKLLSNLGSAEFNIVSKHPWKFDHASWLSHDAMLSHLNKIPEHILTGEIYVRFRK